MKSKRKPGDTPRNTGPLTSRQALAELAVLRKETCSPSDHAGVYVGLEHIDPGYFALKRHGASAEVRSAKSRFHAGDVLYGKLRPYLDKAVVADFDGICSTDILVLEPRGVPAWFLCGLLHTDRFIEHAKQTTNGVNHPRTSWAGVNVFEVARFSRTEQKNIAAVLLKIQRAIETQDRMIQSLRDLKKSTMQHLFTHGLRGEKTKITEIGEIPESWDVVPLEIMGRVGNGSTPKKTNLAYWTNGTIPWLTSGKIHEGVIKAPDQFVSLKAKRECHLPTVRKGGLLIAITGQGKTLGNAAIVDFDSTMSQHLAYVQPDNPDMYPPFIWHYLTTQYEALRQIGFGGGSTKGALTCAALREYPVPRPRTFVEQKEVAKILTDLDAKNAVHKSKKTALQVLFKMALNKLMSGGVRVRDLEIETAEVAG